jgi:hypothetical protein
LEEKAAETPDKQLKGIIKVVEQKTQNLARSSI